jgi:plasmid replication initiation protein
VESRHDIDTSNKPNITSSNDLMPTDRSQVFKVFKSNKLIDAFTRLSKNEYKLLAACISKINPLHDYQGERVVIQLTVSQISELTGISKANIYKFIDQAAKSYHSQPIETPGKAKGEVDYINIAYRSRYDPKAGVFSIEFHNLMQDELVKLAAYTSYELRYLVLLSSKYSMRTLVSVP